MNVRYFYFWERPFQLPFRDSAIPCRRLTYCLLHFQLPFRDSLNVTSTICPFSSFLSTPFSGFARPLLGCVDISMLSTPFSGFLPSPRESSHAVRLFQLPFRDSVNMSLEPVISIPELSTPFSGFLFPRHRFG